MNKISHLVTKFGFKQVTNKDCEPTKEVHKTSISVVKPVDHIHPQFVIQIKREFLDRLNWEISDRVLILTNKHTQHVLLTKTHKKDKNSFAISVQSSSVDAAKALKKGGIVKIGWRDFISDNKPRSGTFDSKLEIFENALLVKLPKEMFKLA